MTFRREMQVVLQDPFAVFNPFYTVDHLLSVPPLFKLNDEQTAACFLFEDNPEVDSEKLSDLLPV